jgi:hypothetical protein
MRRVLFLLTLAWGTLAFSQGTFENTAKAKIITRFTQFRSHKPGQNTGVDSIGNLDQADSATVTSAAVNVAPTYVQTIGADGRTTKTATALSGFAFGAYSAYASGTTYLLTTSYARVDFGTQDPEITLGVAGTYMLFANASTVCVGYTQDAETATLNFKIRKSNAPPADVTNATSFITMAVKTLSSTHMSGQTIPPIIYTTATNNDVLQVWGYYSLAADAGSLRVYQCSIVAIRLY